MKNTIQNTSGQNTSGTARTAFGARRLVIGAASVVAAGALIGVGAQGAFAASGDTGASGSGSATASASTPFGDAAAAGSASAGGRAHGFSLAGQAHALFTGHVNGAKAQQLAKRIVADTAVFSLLPDSLQGDLKTLAGASAHDRTADAKKIVSTALDGGYGSAIQKLADQLKSGERGDDSASGREVENLDVKGLLQGLRSGDLLSTGSSAATQLGADAAGVASAVTGDSQLASKLPDSLRSDLSQLASAPAADRTADVQRIATTALSGGYGDQIQQVADQVEQAVTAAH